MTQPGADADELACLQARVEELEELLEVQKSVVQEHSARLEVAMAELREYADRLENQEQELRLQQKDNSRLVHLATTDGLTGLKNHLTFQECLADLFERSRLCSLPLSLILIDVDRFKLYNDTFGHPQGDLVLKRVAEIMQSQARNTDIAARYGGEEFALILPAVNAEGALIIAERFRDAIENVSWRQRAITVSLGVVTYYPDAEPDIETPSVLIVRSDAALYYSKQHGRNRVTHSMELRYKETLPTLRYTDLLQASLKVHQEALSSTSEFVKETLIDGYNAAITGWSQVLELRDHETQGHTLRVTEMVVRVARAAGMNEEEVLYARWGSLMHDIGKIGIPDSILHKPGPLTEAEWQIMRLHPQNAYDMLSSTGFLRPALDIPYSHHEKWDGSGYPGGLKAEAIPLAARLFAVIEVWDSMCSDRPYRKAWSQKKAISHIRSLSGSHFDPRAVKIFFKVLKEKVLEAKLSAISTVELAVAA